MPLAQFKTGRCLLGPLPAARDLLAALDAICRRYRPAAAAFWVSGALSKLTTGTFDHRQQVYVTHTSEGLFELAACSGTMAWYDDRPLVWAQAVAFDDQGKACGGRLMTPSIMVTGRLFVQELAGGVFPAPILEQMDMTVCRPTGPGRAQGPSGPSP